LTEAVAEELWRGQLALELEALAAVNRQLDELEKKLNALAGADERCLRLMSIPGVGHRLSEVVVATIDDPKRFRNGRQVGSYVGLTPRRYQSGQSDRHVAEAGHVHVANDVTFLCGKMLVRHRGLRRVLRSLNNPNLPSRPRCLTCQPGVALRN
jgi:transposase